MPDEKRPWQEIKEVSGGEHAAKGLIEPVHGLQQRPCLACRSFEKNDKKLRQHIASKKNVEILADGTVRSTIDKDLPGRETITFNIRDYGWCRMTTMPVDNQASCEYWAPTRSVSDLMRKLRNA